MTCSTRPGVLGNHKLVDGWLAFVALAVVLAIVMLTTRRSRSVSTPGPAV
jgi:hypothetical protein